MKNCPKCNALMEDSAAFCTKCGTNVNVSQPQQFVPNMAYQNLNPPKKKTSAGVIVGIVAAVIAIILIIVAICINLITYNKLKSGTEQSEPKSEVSDIWDNPDEALKPNKTSFEIEQINNIISSYTSKHNVAVSVIDLENDRVYETDNANQQFVAAGFYAPLYMVAYTGSNSYLKTQADTMMSTMDNTCANNIIDGIGGMSYLNSVMSHNDLNNTVFNRRFGDVNASNNGYENYTSASDAAKVLQYVYNNGGYTKMNASLKQENISMPSGVYYYAHRGTGIKSSYNIFAVIDGNESSYAVAVVTKDLGSSAAAVKNVAAPLMTDIFANIERQMVEIYE